MSLNIKNPETHNLARELAAILSTTVTSAVTVALQVSIAAHGSGKHPQDRLERLRAISQRAAARVRATPGPDLQLVADDLYDANGLPI